MKTLKPKRTADQETLRQLTKPLRLTDREWLAVENPLEANRLAIQYDENAEAYAHAANELRRAWEYGLQRKEESGLDWIPSTMAETAEHSDHSETHDLIAQLAIFNNLRWALERGNKFLLNETLGHFPIMNYLLKEGPYMPPLDAQFGPEDRHVILKGDHGNLIYFQLEIDGLTKGRYVEYLG